MPIGTAEKHLRKSIVHELAKQLGKNQCCRCNLEIEEPDDLAIVHVQDWEEDSDLFWALTNVAFSHASCEAARSGKRQREKKQMSKVEVRVEDPQGNPLLGARHKGDLYVAGKKGSRYQVRVRNKTNQNVLVVLTVDGRNVITGKPGDHQDSGQVIGPRDTWVFKGWRTSDSQVAAFEFGNKSGSYSSQLGSPQNVGVIGCAVFEEDVPEPIIRTVKETTYIPYPVPSIFTHPYTYGGTVVSTSDTSLLGSSTSDVKITSSNASWSGGSGGTFTSSAPAPTPAAATYSTNSVSVPVAAPAAAAKGPSRKRSRRGRGRDGSRRLERKVQQRLGPEFGEALNSQVRTVTFNRATEDPCEVFVIRYDSMRSLEDRGIMVRPSQKRQDAPQAFPENEGYCQPPGGVRRRRGRRYGSR
jgi:hypothetical protein